MKGFRCQQSARINTHGVTLRKTVIFIVSASPHQSVTPARRLNGPQNLYIVCNGTRTLYRRTELGLPLLKQLHSLSYANPYCTPSLRGRLRGRIRHHCTILPNEQVFWLIYLSYHVVYHETLSRGCRTEFKKPTFLMCSYFFYSLWSIRIVIFGILFYYLYA